ncbi:haloacid dehalogenase-like hydrolase domain-containing protein 3 isoform X2 [Melanotaenia boesemani]|uniref:haloacid dehalogenase-like hydrolase domain-containing protein 3 isoform X2 n=1 Tax=Melanotaenia boesemani TaxID=1250792 RepID=UPI001C056AA0|nr:haloacid dehalogenase-like hydrolase domain-containing protein 3 isoform X2 [Melanotaenia boesemani]XP_041836351.1 haloacid dehalogenase-like hydrolase domain-containing protein 3 isoform X2 [Melanotaenia boesemani]XP_041836352.1 haloacid dehalogenase-like hydrolase domain-containing protein 3 isoform X2 [Melanotaenia boesemani]
MRAPLRWVLWDVKDTLLKVYQSYSRRYPNYGISQGLNGQAWWTGVVRDTLSLCRVQDPALLNTVANNLYHNFCNAENWEVFPDSVRALERCSSLGLKLGVVSNFDSRLEAILHSCGLLSHFSFLITSEEAGVAKPSLAIFDQALHNCGTAADCVAHVGDHYVNDYLSPRSVGIHGFLLDRQNKHNQADVLLEHRLGSLDELPSRLLQLMD